MTMTTSMTAQRHTDATRQAILAAGADLLLERPDEGFSVQDVADRAGLTHRTVYRYFPTRQQLLAATARSLATTVDDDFASVSTVDEWLDAIEPHLARTEANLGLVRRLLAAVLASDDLLFDDRTADRDAHRWGVFRAEFRHLTERDARRTFATLRHLTSSTTYLLYRLRFAMPPKEAVEAIWTAAWQTVEHARLRDRAESAGAANDG